MTLLTISVLVTSCTKNNDNQQTTQQEIEQTTLVTESDASADLVFDDVFDNVLGINDEVGLGGSIGVFGRASTENTAGRFEETDSTGRSFTVTITPLTPGVFPKTVIIDFGTGYMGRDGHIRRGKVITNFTGRMVEPGSKATTTFDGFYFDSVKVEGKHAIQNKSTSNSRIFAVTVENGKLTGPSGNYVAWNAAKTRAQVEGNGTPNFAGDDVFSITGESLGTVMRNGSTYQWASAITEPVIRKFTCRWAVKGKIKITRNDKTGLLDYGNGSCDDQATLTINGNIHSITLR